jgi:hypothetical protein
MSAMGPSVPRCLVDTNELFPAPYTLNLPGPSKDSSSSSSPLLLPGKQPRQIHSGHDLVQGWVHHHFGVEVVNISAL